MAIPTGLIPAERIQRFGPKRLKPMQGQRLNPKTGLWEPKYPKKSPDPRDRQKLADKLKEVAGLPAPAETPTFNLAAFRLFDGYCLLEFGPKAEKDGAIHIPQAQRSSRGVFKIVKAEGCAPDFAPGDMVLLDWNAHQKPVKVDDVDYFITHRNSIAAVVET